MDQPQDVFVSTGQTTVPTPPPVTPQPPVQQIVPPSLPKKRTPMIIVWATLGILVLVALVFAALKFFGPKDATSGDLTWWGLWEEASVIQPLITDFEGTHPNIKITYIKQSPQDYRERLTSSLAKGGGPDIFTFHNT